MSTGPIPLESPVASAEPRTSPHAVVRRPVLDARGRVQAFELLGWPSAGADRAKSVAAQGLLDAIACYRLNRPSELKKLTGGVHAFVCCPEWSAFASLLETMPANLTWLGVPAALDPSEENLGLLKAAKERGFHLVLTVDAWDAGLRPIVELANVVAVDYAACDTARLRTLVAETRREQAVRMARNVQTPEQQRLAQEAGFALFEGCYFCQPPLQRNRRPPVNQMLRIELLKVLQRQPLDIARTTDLVRRDGPLAYQVLRLANSPLWGLSGEVASIERALLTIGDERFRRIATTAIAAEFNGGQPAELLCIATIRARFCEEAGRQRGMDGFTQYLLGLLSLLPAMQGQSMADLAATLPLAEGLREALLGEPNAERILLCWLEFFEQSRWDHCDAWAQEHGLDQATLAQLYLDSVAWSEATLHAFK